MNTLLKSLVVVSIFQLMTCAFPSKADYGCAPDLYPQYAQDFYYYKPYYAKLYKNGDKYEVFGMVNNMYFSELLFAIGNECVDNRILPVPTNITEIVHPHIVPIDGRINVGGTIDAVTIGPAIDQQKTCSIFKYLRNGTDDGKIQEVACGKWVASSLNLGWSLAIAFGIVFLLF